MSTAKNSASHKYDVQMELIYVKLCWQFQDIHLLCSSKILKVAMK